MKLRKKHLGMGDRKLYQLLEPFMLENHIKMGREALFDLLAANQLLVRRRKRRVHTSYTSHGLSKYPNLIKPVLEIIKELVRKSNLPDNLGTRNSSWYHYVVSRQPRLLWSSQ